MKKIPVFLAFFIISGLSSAYAQKIYEINAPASEKNIYTGQLKLGGANPSGEKIEVNSFYVSENGKPVIPVMGEFHYSRYPHEQW